MEVKLYVGNLPYSTTEKDLRKMFARAGSVTAVNLVQDPQLGRSKGIAFVSMGTQAEAQKAIGMFNAHTIADRELSVSVARTRAAQAPGGYAGRLSAFAPSDRRVNPKETRGGEHSRLSAFGGGKAPGGSRRRGNGHGEKA